MRYHCLESPEALGNPESEGWEWVWEYDKGCVSTWMPACFLSVCTWQASTLVGVVTGLMAGAPIETLWGGTGLGGHLACAPAVPSKALTAEWAMCVHADATVKALSGFAAFINIIATVLALIPRWAWAVVVIIPIGATGTVGAGICGTCINQGTILTCKHKKHHSQTVIFHKLYHDSMKTPLTLPLNPRWHTQVNCGIPLATWLLQAAPFRQGERWQGSRCWQSKPI